MNSDSNEIQTLRDRYKESLYEKSNTINEHLHLLLDNDESLNIVGPLRDDLHKLAGSLGMYGYSGLAKIARQAMNIIDEGDVGSLEHELLNLRNLLREHSKS